MGVSLHNLEMGEVQPQCSCCGVRLCWSIDEFEYMEWKEFWDEWKCRECNPNYVGAYEKFKKENSRFQWLTVEILTKSKK